MEEVILEGPIPVQSRPKNIQYINCRTVSNPRSSCKKSTHPTSSSLLCSIQHLALLPAFLYRADRKRLGEWTFWKTIGGCWLFYNWYIYCGPACVGGLYLIKFLFGNLSFSPCSEPSRMYSPAPRCNVHNALPPPVLIQCTPHGPLHYNSSMDETMPNRNTNWAAIS